MQHEVLTYLYDIRESIKSIYNYLGEDTTLEDYTCNKLLKRAVEREFEIIGEATNRILKIDHEIQITDARRIVGLRNWIIHGYDAVDDIIVWGIIQEDLPKLRQQVEKLLDP